MGEKKKFADKLKSGPTRSGGTSGLKSCWAFERGRGEEIVRTCAKTSWNKKFKGAP